MEASRTDELDVKAAAALAGRTAETIRRWVWSGRLPARRRGNRLLVARRDVEALAGGRTALTLADWLTLAEGAMSARAGEGASASDLVLEGRSRRLGEVGDDRGR
ncbi:MAG: helix-turn-helix domain-containing protein [Actinobacteria bacterium]|nr:helix-turn-helix domain-containing protein [Actinomycetota bacterium]